MLGHDNNRVVCIVLGMHRSGTSATAGLLHHLGINMGKKLYPASKYNRKGYYENENILNFNKHILLPRLNTTSTDLSFMPVDSIMKLASDDDLISRAKEIIHYDYGQNRVFGMKDPRLCLVFPFWEKVLKEIDCIVKIIIVYRNPIEVALSLLNRDKIPLVYGIMLWARYILCAEYHTRKCSRIFINYDDVIKRTLYIVGRIKRGLGLEFSMDTDKLNKVRSFIDCNLKHFQVPSAHYVFDTNHWLRVLSEVIYKLSVEKLKYSAKTTATIDTLINTYNSFEPIISGKFRGLVRAYY